MAFTLCWIDIRSIQNICQIDLLFSLESKNIGSICMVNRTSYDTDRSWSRTIINENLIGPLPFFTLKALLLFFILNFSNFDCYLWDLDITFAYLHILLESLFFDPKKCHTYYNKPTAYKCCDQEVFREVGVRSNSKTF